MTLDARAQRSRNALIAAGICLLNENKHASLSDIAQHADVGRATLYRHFSSREELIRDIALMCLEKMDQATAHIEPEADSALHGVELMFRALLPLEEELKFLMGLGFWADDDPQVSAIHRQQREQMMAVAELAKSDGSVRGELPAIWIVNLIEGLLYAAWLTQTEAGLDAEHLAELAFQALCHGIAKDR